MNFNRHLELQGMHAFLSPSRHTWLRYDEQKIVDTYKRYGQAIIGTRMHNIAAELIALGIKLREDMSTLSLYVNDAIGFNMSTEVPLKYSMNCFGTADAISFRDNFLRVHDLKTGSNKVSFDQLLIYAALFCLEYKVNPNDIDIELRIYQNNQISTLIPEKIDILNIMGHIKYADEIVDKTQRGE